MVRARLKLIFEAAATLTLPCTAMFIPMNPTMALKPEPMIKAIARPNATDQTAGWHSTAEATLSGRKSSYPFSRATCLAVL